MPRRLRAAATGATAACRHPLGRPHGAFGGGRGQAIVFRRLCPAEGSTQGSLTLSTPLAPCSLSCNGRPATPGFARPQGERTASSLDELLEQALGSAIPVQALFAWLHGDATTAAGWQADLSRLSDGQLTAVRSAPLPRATLRIALDR
ncbi:MAG: outer membrane lipoprotein LolB [Simplicispira sp.]|nr:outer membrane lipoprotein LolB [Simplicispira sp.]